MLLYASQFLEVKDKISLMSTCKELYNTSLYTYKTDIVKITNDNIEWINKYKPWVIMDDLKYINIVDNSTCIELNIKNNKNIPNYIGNFTNLYLAELDYNYFTILPESIENLSCLRILYLNNNYLRILPLS